MFKYHKQHMGGTEYSARYVNENYISLLPKFKNYYCSIVPGFIYFDTDKENILWMHVNPNECDEKTVEMIKDSVENIKSIIFVSEWQRQNFLSQIQFDERKTVVINNPSNLIEYEEKKFNNLDTVRLIHSSAAYRSLDLLVHCIPKIKHKIDLRIFNDFNPDFLEKNDRKQLKNIIGDQKVYFYGQTPRETLYKYISESHIFVHPSGFKETFCIALTEAMSAGCMPVTSSEGALKEIGGEYIKTFEYDFNDFEKNIDNYAELLNNSIEELKSGNWSPGSQSDFIKQKYSSEKIFEQWKNFHDAYL